MNNNINKIILHKMLDKYSIIFKIQFIRYLMSANHISDT